MISNVEHASAFLCRCHQGSQLGSKGITVIVGMKCVGWEPVAWTVDLGVWGNTFCLFPMRGVVRWFSYLRLPQHPLEGLLNTHAWVTSPALLIQWVWDWTQKTAFLTSSRTLLQVWTPYFENQWVTIKSMDTGLYYLRIRWSWGIYLTSMCLCFLIFKAGMKIIVPTTWGCLQGMKWLRTC